MTGTPIFEKLCELFGTPDSIDRRVLYSVIGIIAVLFLVGMFLVTSDEWETGIYSEPCAPTAADMLPR